MRFVVGCVFFAVYEKVEQTRVSHHESMLACSVWQNVV